jgi:hypothetical protein
MTTQYSPILKLALPVQGELSGTWGDVVNDNITSMVEQAIAGRAVIDTWTTNSHTLTSANGTTSESRCAMLELTDTGTALSGAGTVVCPTASKIYIVKNATGQNITVQTSGGTGILVPDGRTTFLFCDGTNVVEALTHTTSLQLGTSTTVTAVLDEDNMASDSATSLATQQSIKAYVDAQVGANNELSEVLANGNTSGANDIIVDNGQKITTNTIDETTAAAGVTIDSVLLKDDGVNATNLEVTNIKANDGTAAGSIADSTGVVTVASAVLTTADINGGTADGVVIGGSTPAAATVTTATANTSLTIAGTTTVTSILDEDNMASDDPAGLATQQSIKAYVDAQVGANNELSEVLANGNTTGGNDIVFSAGDNISNASGDFTLDVAGDINLDSDSGYVLFKDAGIEHARIFQNNSGDVNISSQISDKDMKFLGNDGGVGFTALTLDMSEAGAATFNSTVTATNFNFSGQPNYSGSSLGVYAGGTFLNTSAATTGFLGVGGQGMVSWYTSGVGLAGAVTINEAGADADFRVESASNANMLFVDGGNNLLGVGMAPDTNVTLSVGGAVGTTNGSAASPTHTFYSDPNTGMFRRGADQLGFSAGGTEYVAMGSFGVATDSLTNVTTGAALDISGAGGVIINETGADRDFRVESSSNADAFKVDAGTSIVLMGASSDVANNSQPKLSVTTSYKESSSTSYDGTLSLVATGGGSTGGRGPQIIFTGEDGASARTLAKIDAIKENSTSGDHDGGLIFRTRKNGSSLPARLHLLSYAAIFNDDNDDTDFIVETSNSSATLFVDGQYDGVGIHTTSPVSYANAQAVLFIEDNTSPAIALSDTGQTRDWYMVAQGSGLYFNYADGSNTGSSSNITEAFQISNGSAGAIFNDGGADRDFRVESNDKNAMFFSDGGTNRIGINTSAPGAVLDVVSDDGSMQAAGIGVVRARPTYAGGRYFNAFQALGGASGSSDTGGMHIGAISDNNADITTGQYYSTSGLYIPVSTSATKMSMSGESISFHADSGLSIGTGHYPTELMQINASGVVVNEQGYDRDFRVESDSNSHMLFVDAGTNAVGFNYSTPGVSKSFASTNITSNFHINSDDSINGPFFQYAGSGVFVGLQNDVGTGTRYFLSFGDSGSNRYGDVTSNGSVMTYGGTSDYRLKTNVQPMSGSIDRVKQLNPVTFDWISSGVSTEGFIAHELQAVVPDAATGVRDEVDDNGRPIMQQVDPRHVVPLLTSALQEAIAKIETLEARITALENA